MLDILARHPSTARFISTKLAQKFVADDPPPNCICFDFAREGADSFAYYAVRYWLTDLAADDPTSSAVRVRIYVALKRAGIPLAVPGQAIWVSMDDPQHRERKVQRELQHRMEVLQHIEMFAGLSHDDRQRLAEGMQPAPFGRAEIITRQDSVAHWLYVLTKGECEVRVRGEAGGEKLVARLSAPNVFGEMGVMTGERRTASHHESTHECPTTTTGALQGSAACTKPFRWMTSGRTRRSRPRSQSPARRTSSQGPSIHSRR